MRSTHTAVMERGREGEREYSCARTGSRADVLMLKASVRVQGGCVLDREAGVARHFGGPPADSASV